MQPLGGLLESLIVKTLAVVGIFFPGVGQHVAMSRPVVELRQDSIAVSCFIERPLSDDLRNIIESGTAVRLTFIVRLREANGEPVGVPDTAVTHRVTKNLADGVYEISLGRRELRSSRLSHYSPLFRLETVPLWPVESVEARKRYIVEVSARLEPIYVHATGETFDLMALWNFRMPKGRSEAFTRELLEQRRVRP